MTENSVRRYTFAHFDHPATLAMPAAASRLLLVAFSLGVAFAPVQASGLDDPFDTEAMAPLKPSPQLSGRIGAAPCATALPAAPLGVLDAVDLTLCNNPQTREVWASARAQAALVGVAKAAWLPAIDGRLAAARTWSEGTGTNQRSAALTLSWLLLDFGGRAATLENARQLLAAASASQDAAVQNLFLAALQAYYTAQATAAAVESAKEAERAAQESFNAAQVRYQVGAGTPADRLQAQTALSQATLNRLRAEGERRNALGVLASVMGFDAGLPITLAQIADLTPDAVFDRDMAALIAEARQRRPDLRAAEAQVRAATAGIDVARASGRPKLSLSAGPAWQNVGGIATEGGSLGVTINVPLFTGFDTTYRVRAAEAQAEAQEARRDSIARQVALDVWQSWQSLATASQSLKTSADLVASAEQSAKVALGRYKAGVGSILDVLTAQSALAAARQQRIQAALDWQVYRATLAQSMGSLDYGLLQPVGGGRSQP